MEQRLDDISICENEKAVGKAAAKMIAQQIQQKPDSVLLLPTGRTPLDMYAYLVEMVNAGQVDLSRIATFNLDEFYGLPQDHPGTFRSYMQRVFFSQVQVPAERVHFLDSNAADPAAECDGYEQKIRERGGIDLAILGIGVNGHIGFNEPGSAFDSRTRLVPIREETRAANAFLFNDHLDKVPTHALTTGIGTILDAKKILLLATGRSKANAIHEMIHGDINPELPASALRMHSHVTVLLDSFAAPESQETGNRLVPQPGGD